MLVCGKVFKKFATSVPVLKDDNALLYSSGRCFFFLTLGLHQGILLFCVSGYWGREVGFGKVTLLAQTLLGLGLERLNHPLGFSPKLPTNWSHPSREQNLTLYEKSQR